MHDLERQWLAQLQEIDRSHEITKGQRIDGIGFIGFSNINFANFWLDPTPEFEALRGDRQLAVRGLGLSDVSERQRRRRANAMMIMFDEVLSGGGCGSQAQEEAFTILIRNSQFKDKFGDLLESEFGDKYASGLVEGYKACLQRKASSQARLLLSTFASLHTREETMRVFGCSARQVKAARLTWMLRTVTEAPRPLLKYNVYPRDTVDHLEGWALNPKQVMRSAGGTAKFLLRANRNRLFLMYQEDCKFSGIKGMGRKDVQAVKEEESRVRRENEFKNAQEGE